MNNKEITIKNKKDLSKILKSFISDTEVLESVVSKIKDNDLSNIVYSEEYITSATEKKEKSKKLKLSKTKSVSLSKTRKKKK